jgi:hypothetical protein
METKIYSADTDTLFTRCAWTGGDTPPARHGDADYRAIRRALFRESVRDCGGLGLWECAGTSALDRARIFWNRARLDSWATIRNRGRELAEHIRTGDTFTRYGMEFHRDGQHGDAAGAYAVAARHYADGGADRKAYRAAAAAERSRNRQAFYDRQYYATNYGPE